MKEEGQCISGWQGDFDSPDQKWSINEYMTKSIIAKCYLVALHLSGPSHQPRLTNFKKDQALPMQPKSVQIFGILFKVGEAAGCGMT